MNNVSFRSFALVIILTFFSTAFATVVEHEKTATFKVYGNCAMCIDRIQDAALKDKHVKSAEWNIDTKILTVV